MAGWMHTAWLVVLGGIAAAILPGCNAESAIELLEKTAEAPAPPTATIPRHAEDRTQTASRDVRRPAAVPAPAAQRDRTKLRIGSFNIQAFGPTKAGRPETLQVLAELISRFDVIAIQEIRSKDPKPFMSLIEKVNEVAQNNSQFEYVVGPRLGNTVSKEQYAYVWDATRVAILPTSVYTLADDLNDFHREPLVATFQANLPSGRTPFRFTLINIHTDPSSDAIDWELDQLDNAVAKVQRDDGAEDDLILLGDLNTDDAHIGELSRMRNIIPLLRSKATNTRKDRMYDNFVVHRIHTNEWTGRSGVVDFAAEYGMGLDEALTISDHMPIWADFEPFENAGQFMDPGPVVR